MEAINAISRFFTAKHTLHEAARKGNLKKVEQLINIGMDVNAYYGPCTPLQKCLFNKKIDTDNAVAESALVLLKSGANPNASYKFNDNRRAEKTIQPYVDGEHSSIIRLLIMFGATSEGVYLNTATPEIKDLFLKTHQLYQRIKQLEMNIAQLQDHDERKANDLLELGNIWKKLSQEENIEVYRNYYQKKADHYLDLADNLKPSSNISEKFTDNGHSLRRRFKDEEAPLLPKENPILSFRK